MRGTTKRSVLKVGITMLFLLSSMQVFAGIAGSAHDFSALGWSGGQICKACHTPHNASNMNSDAPLWDHTITSATFTVYSSTTLNASPGQPTGVSKLCLSCHDGTVALDAYTGGAAGTMISGGADLGTDLGNSHPISFTYDTALYTADGGATGGLKDPSVATTDLGGTIAEDLLTGDVLHCNSCHDVHNSESIAKLLLIDNANSDLCLTCHNK